MTLRQREYCHNCNQYVIYEFEDITDRQVIICPNCKHQHYRELDEGTILNIRINPECRTIRIAKFEMPLRLISKNPDEVGLEPLPIEYEEREIIGKDETGRPIVKPKEAEDTRKIMTNRRWGRDPRQI